MKYHLAQLNIASLLHPIDHPVIKEFVDNLDRINALAENSEGFVWRLKDETGNATEIEAFENPLIIANMSVWENAAYLKAYVYKSDHVNIMRKRKQWFAPSKLPFMVMWWIPEGHEPTLIEAKERLEYLQENGESAYAFSFRNIFEAQKH